MYISLNDLNVNEVIQNILTIPFAAQGASIFWFVYTLVALYIISPVISPWLEKTDKRTLQLYLEIWGVSLCYAIFSNWLSVGSPSVGVFYYMSGYVGFYVLGYYLKRYGVRMKLSAAMYIIAFAIMLTIKVLTPEIKLYDGFWYLTPFCLVSVIFYWNTIVLLSSKLALSDKAKNEVITCSNLIFGVYFIHWGIKEYLLPQLTIMEGLPYLAYYALRVIIVFVGALALSYIVSYLPCADYIIGYKKKRI